MNREIKFRAWDGEKIVHPDYIDRDGVAWWTENSIPEKSTVIMQFTGLKDRRGLDIYEGDLLLVAKNHTYEVVFLLEDEYGEMISSFGLRRWDETFFAIDHFAVKNGIVVGSIYENPELLNP